MLDIRYIVGSLIITVAAVAFAISLIVPTDRTTTATATLKPRIEPSRVVEQPAPEKKQQITTVPQIPATVPAPAPKQATAPVPGGPKQPIAAAPAPAPAEVTGSIGEKKAEAKPAPRRIVQPQPKEEPAFQFPWFKGFGQQN